MHETILKNSGGTQICRKPFAKNMTLCGAHRLICKTYGAVQVCRGRFAKRMALCRAHRQICKKYGAMQIFARFTGIIGACFQPSSSANIRKGTHVASPTECPFVFLNIHTEVPAYDFLSCKLRHQPLCIANVLIFHSFHWQM